MQSTEIEHSRHVIAELLEIIIRANADEFDLAEIEGDALFFYKEGMVPSLDKLMAKVEAVFSAFYSHLKLMEKNRICPCNACATAPNLDLKIVAHSGELHFISVQDREKPFGTEVIEVHRLLKNSIDSQNYLLLSRELTEHLGLSENYKGDLFTFSPGKDIYDDNPLDYQYALLEKDKLELAPFAQVKQYEFDRPPNLSMEKDFPIPAAELFEYISNFVYRHHLVDGDHSFEFNENEVTRIGSKHVCVVDGDHIDFVTVTKAGEPGQLIYGELTTTPRIVDELFSFSVINPLGDTTCKLETQIYWTARSPLKKLAIALFVKKQMRKNIITSIKMLTEFVDSRIN